MIIGKLERVPLRQVWQNEARDFTSWLAENLEVLGETLGMNLSLVEREAPAGHFFADILAEDPSGNLFIIENQLERTDHDHLGKLITYLSVLGAKGAIWVSSDPRPEHETAIHWLNQFLPADVAFYLLRVEAYRIGDSPPAPLLTVVAGGSPEVKQIGQEKQELAGRHVLRLRFWEQLLQRAKERTSLHAQISPSKENWIIAGAGISGLGFAYVIRLHDAQVGLYIDRSEAEENKAIFDQLLEKREQIEAEFGQALDWQRLEQRRVSRICLVLPNGGLRDRERWPAIQDAMVVAMVRLERALRPCIKQLKV